MTAGELKAWRQRLDLSQDRAAELLGLSRRGFQNLETGLRPIQRYIALACAAVETASAVNES
jgi:DNA-binding XRE family transcriptional regulator